MRRPARGTTLPFVIGGLAAAGAAISGYLTYVHAAGQPVICGGQGSCAAVQSSEYASVGGVPVALAGFGLYLTVAALAFGVPGRPIVLLAVFGLSLGGALYSAYLTWVEVAVLGAICYWCVASAIVVGLLAIVSGAAVFRASDPLPLSRRLDQRTPG
ncbi:MAG: vitamin K epoxide reductase family protein [Dehalococcoidia bacterium]